MLSFALFEEDSFFAWHSFGSIRYKIEGSKLPISDSFIIILCTKQMKISNGENDT
jgi:hypothetical protein